MQLYPHQKKALEMTQERNRVAYYLDMGLGKTFVGAEKAVQMETNIILVVCQKSKVQDWIDHFRWQYLWIDDVVDLTDKKSFELFKGLLKVTTFPPKYLCVAVINYDLVFRRPALKQLTDFTLMLDESSLIQNEKNKRTKFIMDLNPSSVILLSGTPTSGKYENLWTQIHLLGWNISQDTYNKQYINWTLTEDDGSGIRHKIVDMSDPYKNVDRLKQKMRDYGAIFMKTEECFDLPEQNFITVNVKTSKEYKWFGKYSVIKIPTDNEPSPFDGMKCVTEECVKNFIELVGDTVFTKILYSRMLCGQYNQEKLEAFKDLVESTQDRLIVFYNFDGELEQLKKIAKALERPISEVNGHCKDLTAYDQEDDSITFIQYQSGSMGLNLQKANKVVYFTLPLSSEHFEQSKKRVHRIGQEKPCFYYQMICKGSIEEKILATLQMRKDFTDELFKEGEEDD